MRSTTRMLTDRDDAVSLVWAQRATHLQALARLTKLRAAKDLHPGTAMLLDGAILRAEADLKWLDLCEQRLSEGGPQ